MLLGFFLLIAKYSNLKIGQEGESGNLQNCTKLLRKEYEEKLKEKKKGKRREKKVRQSGNYRFKESGIGGSWLIGDDSNESANSYVNGLSGCEETLEIPRELTDENQNTRKVEVIGQFAFNQCGDEGYGITRSIVLTRNIKVIKTYGLGNMDDVTSFRIEEGSFLESIEYLGLSFMSWEKFNVNDRRSILVLPSTVTSIAADGLLGNNMIKTIYYCGSTHLSNYSDLVFQINAPDIKVTSSYKYDTIFGNYTPNKDSSSIVEAEEKCKSYGFIPKASRSPMPSSSRSHSPLSPSPPAEEDPILSKYSKFLAATHLIKS